MFYPKCECGGSVETAESDMVQYGNRHVGHWLRQQAMAGHAHRYLKAASVALSVGDAIYKRWPGGGLKRCTACGKQFR